MWLAEPPASTNAARTKRRNPGGVPPRRIPRGSSRRAASRKAGRRPSVSPSVVTTAARPVGRLLLPSGESDSAVTDGNRASAVVISTLARRHACV
jgi:hypothetical protein